MFDTKLELGLKLKVTGGKRIKKLKEFWCAKFSLCKILDFKTSIFMKHFFEFSSWNWCTNVTREFCNKKKEEKKLNCAM